MRGRSERGLMRLGDILQPHSEESVGQRTWKGSSGVGSSWSGRGLGSSSYLLLAEVG